MRSHCFRLSQHFLLSAKARTLSLVKIARMSDDEARATFRAVRFAESGGRPTCPHCHSDAVLEFRTRPLFKCKVCERQFTITSGTIFASRKLSFRDILAAIALFVNGASGVSALRLGRELDCSYKTAFVLLHKLREAMSSMRVSRPLTGIVEIDGVWVGGHYKQANIKAERKDGRTKNPKRLSVVTMRERRPGGRTVSVVVRQETQAFEAILRYVDRSAKIRTDEGSAWTALHLYFDEHKAINHSVRYAEPGGVHTNWAESYNSRVRRAERGVHHRIWGRYLLAYAEEMGWREDFRRVDNGRQFSQVLMAAAKLPVSRAWSGYWQRHLAAA